MMSGGTHGAETTITSRHLHPLFVPPPSTSREPKSGERTPSGLSPSRPPTPPPPRRKRRTAAHGVPPTPVLPFEVQSVVLVRDPPKDQLVHYKESLGEDEGILSARAAGKPEFRFGHNYPSLNFDSATAAAAQASSTTKRSSLTASEDFFADLYDYYYDDAPEEFVFPTPKPPKPLTLPSPSTPPSPPLPQSNLVPSDHPPKRVTKSKSVKDTTSNSSDTAMAKKRRGSLQAIFVPSFLQSSGALLSTASVPSSPTNGKFASSGHGRTRGFSGAAPSAPATPSGAPYAFPPSSPSFPSNPDAAMPHVSGSEPGSPIMLVNTLPPIVPLTPEVVPNSEQHQRKMSITFNMSKSSFSSPRSSPPPDFLLDDDPFANLTGPPIDRVGVPPPVPPIPPVPPLPAGTRPAPAQVPLPATPVEGPAGLGAGVSSPVTPISPPPIPRSPLHESPPCKLASLEAAALASASGTNPPFFSASTSITTSSSSPVISASASMPAMPSTSSSGSTSPVISVSASASALSPRLNALAPSKPIMPALATAPPSSPPAARGSPILPSRTRPAYQRPAFSSRPSLPSLDTLARMNVVLTKKVRKGRVGAGLPFEPWDLPSDEELPSAPGTRPHTPVRVHSASPSLSSTPGSSPTTPTSSTAAALSPEATSAPVSIPSSSSERGTAHVAGLGSRPSSPSHTPTGSMSTTPSLLLHGSANIAPMSPSIAKPQPLLPSQIMALGSVIEDVEMILPVSQTPVIAHPAPPPMLASTASASFATRDNVIEGPNDAVIDVSNGTSHLWLADPLSGSATGDFAAKFADEMEAELAFVSSRPNSVYNKVRQGREDENNDAYLGDYLERYHVESRAASDEGHGDAVGEVMETQDAGEELQRSELQAQSEKEEAIRESNDGHGEYSYLFRRSLVIDAMYDREAALPSTSTSAFEPDSTGFPSGSMIFSSPPSYFTSPPSLTSSMSLSRSLSSTSYSSLDSADSADSVEAVESADVAPQEEETQPGTWRRNHRRFGGQNPSLSSLELDLEGGGGMDESLERQRSPSQELSTSTRSSSSHPSLSRTRSSSEDSSDILHSPVQGDYSSFPYERAREVHQLQQQGLLGYHPYSASALFEGPFAAPDREGFGGGRDETERRMLSVVDPSFSRGSFSTSGRPDHDQEVSEEFALSAFSGEGLSFGFGYDNLGLPETAAEVGVEDEKKKTSFDHATNTTNMTTSTGKLSSSTSSFGDRNRDESTAPASTFTPSSGHSSGVDELQHVDLNSEYLQNNGSPNSEISFTSPTPSSPVRPGPTNLVVQATSLPLPLPDHLPSEDMTSSSSLSRSVLRTSPKTVESPRVSGLDVDFPPSPVPTSKTSPTSGEMRDSSAQNGYRSRGTSGATSSAYRGGSSYGQEPPSNSTSYTATLSSTGTVRLNRGFNRNNGDEEDEEEEEKKRRAFRKIHHMNDATIRLKPKPTPSSSSSEDEDDGGASNEGNSGAHDNYYLSVPRPANSISRSPSSGESFVTASSSPSLQPMEFPTASSGSSRYASEDEGDHDEVLESDEDEDDDVPLAQRIPGALTAQKSIRRQFKEERERRKKAKAMKTENTSRDDKRARQITLRPAGAGIGPGVNIMGGTSSQDAALLAGIAAVSASTANQSRNRQRTLTLPGKPAATEHAAFDPYDLTKKLQNVQLSENATSPTYQQPALLPVPSQPLQQGMHTRSKSISRSSADHQRQPQGTGVTISSNPLSPPSVSPNLLHNRSKTIRDPNATSHLRHPPPSPPLPVASPPAPVPVKISSLRPMRSLHHADGRPPLSSEGDQRLGRSSTSARRTSNEQKGHGRQRSASRSRVSGERSEENPPPLPVGGNVNPKQAVEEQRKLVMSPTSPDMRLHSTRTSGELERSHRPSNVSQQPQLPQPASKTAIFRQRVFVGNLQQFYMVEVGPSTTAGDVVSTLDSQGALTGWAGSGGWMVFEVAQDFGMERPVRSYELLADIQSSWLKDKTVNLFILKLTPLSVPLSRSAIPASSPTHSGYVEWEAKRGKWNKRWLQLREHCLWLSKRDNGKDEVLLCSLSNFDAYRITRNHKSPKPFAFAIKSTDNLSFFENTDDYMHTFSCSEKDGNAWLEKILIARSYVLYQERHVLFSPKTSSDNPPSSLARSGTKKHAPPNRPAPSHPPLPPLLSPKSLTNDVFEPGSLLAKQL